MLTGRCSACGVESSHPDYLGGLTVRCLKCCAGWIALPARAERSTPAADEAPLPALPPLVYPPPRAVKSAEPAEPPSKPVPVARRAPPPPTAAEAFYLEPRRKWTVSRVAGVGCLIPAILLLVVGAWHALGDLGDALRGDAGAMGSVCGSFILGGAVLTIAVYLIRRDS